MEWTMGNWTKRSGRRFGGAGCLVALALAGTLAACAPLDERPAPIVERSIGVGPGVVAAGAAANAAGSVVGAATPEHVIARGETLYSIAFRNGLDYRELARWNNIDDPALIGVGQRLRLGPPSATSVPTPSLATSAGGGGIREPQAARFETLTDNPRTPSLAVPTPSTGAGAAPVAAVAAPIGTLGGSPSANPVPVIREAVPSAPVASAAVTPSATPAGSAVAAAGAAAAGQIVSTSGGERAVDGVRWRWPTDGRVIRSFGSGDPTRQGLGISGNQGQAVVAAADGEVVYSGNGLIGFGELIIIKHSDALLSAYGHNRKRLVDEGSRVRAGQVVAEMGRSGGSVPMVHFEIRRNGRPVDPRTFLPPR